MTKAGSDQPKKRPSSASGYRLSGYNLNPPIGRGTKAATKKEK